MTDSAPQLPPPPGDDAGGAEPMLRTERGKTWELLIRHINDWRRPLAPGDGYTAEELDAAEAKLGFRLPAALREVYQLVGRRRDFVASPSMGLVPPMNLQYGTKDDPLVVCENDPGIMAWSLYWGIWHSDLHRPDPPINGWSDRQLSVELSAQRIDRFSGFLLQSAVFSTAVEQELPKAAGVVSAFADRLSPKATAKIQRTMRADFLPPLMLAGEGYRFFEWPGEVVLVLGNPDCYVACKDQHAFERLRKSARGTAWRLGNEDLPWF